MRPFHPALRIALSIASTCSQPCSGATSGRYVADNVRRGTKGNEEDEEDEDEDGEEDGKDVKGRERSEMAEESGEGASEAEGLVGSGVNEIWMPCVPMVQSRYEEASSKSVRSDTLAPQHIIPYHRIQTKPPTQKKKTIVHGQKDGIKKEKRGMSGEGSDVCMFAGGGLRTRIRARATRAARPSETDDPEMRSTARTLPDPHEAAEHQTCQCTLSNACSIHHRHHRHRRHHYCAAHAYACSTSQIAGCHQNPPSVRKEKREGRGEPRALFVIIGEEWPDGFRMWRQCAVQRIERMKDVFGAARRQSVGGAYGERGR